METKTQENKQLISELLQLRKALITRIKENKNTAKSDKQILLQLNTAIKEATNKLNITSEEVDPVVEQLKQATKELLAIWLEIETLQNSLVPNDKGMYVLTSYLKDQVDNYAGLLTNWEHSYKKLSKKQAKVYEKEYKGFPIKVERVKKDLNNIQALCEILSPPAAKSVEDLQKQYDNVMLFAKKADEILNLNQKEISKATYYELINYKVLSYDLIEVLKKTPEAIVETFCKQHNTSFSDALKGSFFKQMELLSQKLIERSKRIDTYLASITISSSKNSVGLTESQMQDKMDTYFKAYDGIQVTVTLDNKKHTIGVESPYFINKKKSNSEIANAGDDVGTKSQLALLRLGKGDPITLQKWLQKEIDEDKKLKGQLTKIKGSTLEAKLEKATNVLQRHMKTNKVGIDCSGFVSQFFNHVSDKDGDMIYDKGDKFNPENMSSTDLSTLRYGKKETVMNKNTVTNKGKVPNGNQTFKKVTPENVQVGDTLYYHNAGGTDHIRIVRDVQKVNETIYYTIYESSGKTGPREMRWKYENSKLYEYNPSKKGGTWKLKKHEHFSRWTPLEIPGTSTGGIVIPFPEEEKPTTGKVDKKKKAETIKFQFRTAYLAKNNQPTAYSLITKVLRVSWGDVIKLNGEKKVKQIKDKETILLPKSAKMDALKK